MKQLRRGSGALRLGVCFLVENANAREVLAAYDIARSVGANAFFLKAKTMPHSIGLIPLSPSAREQVRIAFETILSQQCESSDLRFFYPPWYPQYLCDGYPRGTEKVPQTCYLCGALQIVVTPPDPGVVWACSYFHGDPKFHIADLDQIVLGSVEFAQSRREAVRRIFPPLAVLS